jgi:protein SCO1
MSKVDEVSGPEHSLWSLSGAWRRVHFMVLFLGLSILAAACGQPHQLQGLVWQQPRTIGFTLTDQHGQPFSLQDLQGKVALLYFGYTVCPDACPTTMVTFVQIKRQLGQDANRAQFVMISVDPEHDTQDALQQYLEKFDPSFIGLWGDAPAIEEVTKAYGIIVDHPAVGAAAAEIQHDTSIWLLDKQGRVRTIYPLGTASDVIVADIQALLRES